MNDYTFASKTYLHPLTPAIHTASGINFSVIAMTLKEVDVQSKSKSLA